MESYSSYGLNNVKPHEPELTGNVVAWLNPGMARRTPPESEVQGIARRLKAAREAMGITAAELCRRTGIAPNTYSQWEAAKGRPELDQAKKLCKSLRWTLDYIYLGDPSGLPHGLAVKLGVGAA